MTKNQQTATPTEESIGTAMSRTELFFENNGKALLLALIVLVLLGGLGVGYRSLVTKPRNQKAAELLAQAQSRFEADDADYGVALNGDDNGARVPRGDRTLRLDPRGQSGQALRRHLLPQRG